jgi:hypothetical protein
MSLDELKESIEFLRKKLSTNATTKGFTDERTVEIKKRLDLYLERYRKLKDLQ